MLNAHIAGQMKIEEIWRLCGAFLMLATVSCSQKASDSPPSLESDYPGTSLQQEFSEEDKRVASALALDGKMAGLKRERPYEQALLCNHGLEVLGERTEGMGLSEAQRNAIATAQAHFLRQAEKLGIAEGRGTEEIVDDRRKIAAESFDDGKSVRYAMQCLENLL